MSSIEQARGAVLGALTVGLPVWLAVTVDDDDGTRLRSGQEISLVVELCNAMSLDTVFVNCSIPEAVDMAVGALTGCGLRVGVYANGFTRINDAFLEPGHRGRAATRIWTRRPMPDLQRIGSPEGSTLWAAAARWGQPISRFWQNDSSPMQESDGPRKLTIS